MTKRQDSTTAQLSTTPSGAGAPAPGAPRALHRRRRRVTRVAAAATAVLAAGALVVGCGKDPEPAPEKVGGDAAPAGSDKSGDSTGGDSKNGSEDTGGKDGDGSGSDSASDSKASGSSSADSSSSKSGSGSSSGSRCGTGDLKASFGDNHPGAGQENFALVLTNRSDDTCTVRGYPGLAFVNDDGEQVSFDPQRTGGKVRTVELSPGKSAWAPLSFTNPKMTNVTTVTPSAAKVTPPDERGSLRVNWSGGPVTNTGKASVPKIGPLSPGTGG
ncbi:DUF4232 domain-containing protein [Streptomyces qinglanensis]|uniref:DUF4232 domain-containing protein n=1 Tax=Streptomyces qinglanensis TaxID=943816 RepID=A0A1H9Q915_9ACTN|nr:DUF4232 domain-containing protein [Streptomyces qinglanensis]SER56930.1 Protein of unknown function [Streptomyces qinglanensis]